MSSADPQRSDNAASPDSPSAPKPSSPKRIVYQVETTGNYWTDVKEAVKRISVRDDLSHINEIPCARNSLLSGIASGVGIGIIRGMSTSVFAASNWAVGTFMLISLGTWTICQKNLEEERRRIQQVMEVMPKQLAKSKKSSETSTDQKST